MEPRIPLELEKRIGQSGIIAARDLIQKGDWDSIAKNAAEAVKIYNNVRG